MIDFFLIGRNVDVLSRFQSTVQQFFSDARLTTYSSFENFDGKAFDLQRVNILLADGREGIDQTKKQLLNLKNHSSNPKIFLVLLVPDQHDYQVRLAYQGQGIDFTLALSEPDFSLVQYIRSLQSRYECRKVHEKTSAEIHTFKKLSDLIPGTVFQFQLHPSGHYSFPFFSRKINMELGGVVDQIKDDPEKLFSLVLSDDLPGLLNAIDVSFHTLALFQYQFKIKHPLRGVMRINVVSQPEKQEDNSVIWHGIATDGTAQKKEEDHRQLLSLIADNTDNIIVITDQERQIIWVNKSFEKLTSYTLSEVYRKSPGEILQGDDFSVEQRKEIRETLTKGLSYKGEAVNYTKSGKPYWIYMDIQPVFEADGTLTKYIAIETNITQRKIREEQLRINEERFRMIAENINEGLIVTGQGNIVEYVSPAHEKLYGYTYDDIVGKKGDSIFDHIHPEDRDSWKFILDKAHLNKEEQVNLTFRIRTLDGVYRWRKDISRLIYDEEGKLIKSYTVCHDIDKDMLAREELKAERNKIRAILEASPAAIIVVNMDGQIVMANRASVKLFGRKLNDLLSHRFGEFIGCVNQVNDGRLCGTMDICHTCRLYKGIKDVLGDIESCYIREEKVNLVTLTGIKEFWLSFSIESLILDQNRHAIVALTDISKQKIAQDFENQLLVAQRTASIKQNFLANMSHEMRTPLNGIIGISDILRKTPLNDKQLEYLDILEDSSNTLLNLINSVLDLSKIESGAIEINKNTIETTVFHSKISSLYNAIAANKSLRFLSEIGDDFPAYFITDENKLNQIITNLLGNAIKFTKKGSIQFKASIINEGRKEYILRFDVTDSGRGIPQDKLEDIFEQFTQVDDAKTRYVEGTGLGLAIAKNLVKILEGDIHVESNPGQGSNFWFTIKAAKADVTDISPDCSEFSESFDMVALDLKVLIVEDLKVNRLVVNLMLESMGCETDFAENGLVALHKITANKYDVVLMDVQMPVMDGLNAVKELKSLKIPLPVIIGLSAEAMEGDAEKYISAGMDDYMTKPVKSNVLARKLIQWSNRKNSSETLVG